MRAIEGENPDLKDVLPKTYNRLENSSLVELLKIMASIPMDIEGDAFGKIYEYFLGKFAMAEGEEEDFDFPPPCHFAIYKWDANEIKIAIPILPGEPFPILFFSLFDFLEINLYNLNGLY